MYSWVTQQTHIYDDLYSRKPTSYPDGRLQISERVDYTSETVVLVETKLGDDVPRHVSLDCLLGVTLCCLQQPVELCRVKLLHSTSL